MYILQVNFGALVFAVRLKSDLGPVGRKDRIIIVRRMIGYPADIRAARIHHINFRVAVAP